MKAKKGSLAVLVGSDEEEDDLQKFVIPISYLYHPLMERLLEKARDLYGYQTVGPLRLPCSVDDFLHLRWMIEKEGGNSSHQLDHYAHHPHFHPSLSCTPC